MNKNLNLTYPFWSWSGNINKKEIKKQLKYFKEMGYGGFFIHPRTGLETEYLSKRWFELVNYCIEESAKIGLKVFLYDEDRYPSGTCGGEVTKDLRFVRRHLCMAIADEYIGELYDSVIGVFSVDLDGEYLLSYKKYEGETGKKAIFYLDYAKPSTYFNGQPYLDTINCDATKAFLNFTHEKYKKHCGKHFGSNVCGIFSDEVGYGHLFCVEEQNNLPENRQVPYTLGLFVDFFEKYGYRIEDRLPELFFAKKEEPLRKIAWQYVNLLQEKFLHNFAEPYSEWCKNNGISYTGHILQEETLSTQTVCCGSAMRFYQYMDLPGIDVLMENGQNYWMMKQVVSVKKQLGKRHAVAECYGATGYNVTLERYKKMSDLLSVFGITLKVPHLAPYTMKGRAKRDYPANLFYQNSGYGYANVLEKYSENLAEYICNGEDLTDVCVIHPIESVWAMAHSEGFNNYSFSAKDKNIQAVEKDFTDTFYALLGANIDFDYADEGLISKYCSVKKENGKAKFIIGEKQYSVVVLYENRILRKSTFNLLRLFADLGGKVVYNSQKLRCVDFESITNFNFEGFNDVRTLAQLTDIVKNDVEFKIQSNKNIVFNVRRCDNNYYLFAVNLEREKSLEEALIETCGEFYAYEIDLLTKQVINVEYVKNSGKTTIKSLFAGGQSRLFLLSKIPQTAMDNKGKKYKKLDLQKEFSYWLSEENVLLMDNVCYYIDGKNMGEEYVRNADKNVRNYFSLEQKKELMCQPYYKRKYHLDYDKELCKLDLEYSFNCQYIPKEIYLAIEQCNEFKIKVNGRSLEKVRAGLWVDNCFTKLKIPSEIVRVGKNIITLTCNYKDSINIENVYLVGDFGVANDCKTLINLPKKLTIGNITKQGLPFYRGKVIYKTDINGKNFKVCFNGESGYAQSVITDGKTVPICFYPYQAELSGEVKSLSFEISLSGQNVFGPVHNTDPNLPWVGPFAYEDFNNGNFTREYLLKEQGLLREPEIFIATE